MYAAVALSLLSNFLPRAPRLIRLIQVIDGFDVLDVIEKAPVGKKERPVTDILIKDITIHANPIAENG